MTHREHLNPVPAEQPDASAPDTSGTAEAMDNARTTVLSLLAALDRPPSSVRVSAGGVDLELAWAAPVAAPVTVAPPAAPAATAPAAVAPAAVTATEPPATVPDAAPAVDHIHAPTVGVFYRRPDPSSGPFVEEGETVRDGQQVGIVEAMKLMIPVVSDRTGVIGEALVEDGTSVEYGAALFTLVPSAEG